MFNFVFSVKENESDEFLELCRASMMEHFWKNIERLKAFTYICENAVS